jgi:hypothetical protein
MANITDTLREFSDKISAEAKALGLELFALVCDPANMVTTHQVLVAQNSEFKPLLDMLLATMDLATSESRLSELLGLEGNLVEKHEYINGVEQ